MSSRNFTNGLIAHALCLVARSLFSSSVSSMGASSDVSGLSTVGSVGSGASGVLGATVELVASVAIVRRGFNVGKERVGI